MISPAKQTNRHLINTCGSWSVVGIICGRYVDETTNRIRRFTIIRIPISNFEFKSQTFYISYTCFVWLLFYFERDSFQTRKQVKTKYYFLVNIIIYDVPILFYTRV